MYQAMRRNDRAMPDDEAWKILAEGIYGTMALTGPDGEPYAVPLSYVVLGRAIYFHCASEGRKLAGLAHCPRVCFNVVKSAQAVYDHNFSTYYESVTVFGPVTKVEGEQRKTGILMKLAEKYLSDFMARAPSDIARSLSRTMVYKIEVEHITGKRKLPRAGG